MNVGQLLHRAASAWPTRVGVLDVGEPYSVARAFGFALLDAQARSVAALLHREGLGVGDAVALIGENSAEFVVAWFGIVYAGCAVVPVPIHSAANELLFRVTHADCKALLFDEPRTTLVNEALAHTSKRPLCMELQELIEARAAPVLQPVETSGSDTAMVLYTSGTTGKAKGAAISHASLLTHTEVLSRHALRLQEDDRVLGVLPLTHSYGCRMVLLASCFAGATAVLAPRFSAARSLALLREEAITWLPVVPTMLAAWAALPEVPPLPALRWCLSAGAPLAEAVARRAEQRLGVEVRQGYGLTEATFCTINAPPDLRVFGSVGQPLPGIELRVVDETGRAVSAGQDGELLVRGHNVMSGYLHDAEATHAVYTEGFLHTGDVGRIDQAGRLTIVDRIKDLILRGGHNVYPAEVEAVLAAHPDVREVAVIGKPDDYYGEEIVAVVIKKAGSMLDAPLLLAFAQARLARTKVPREVLFVDALPLGPSGKVQRRTLREWLRQRSI